MDKDMILLCLLCVIVVLVGLAYNVGIVNRDERRETAKEMRQALKWADRCKMKEQADYRAVLRGR